MTIARGPPPRESRFRRVRCGCDRFLGAIERVVGRLERAARFLITEDIGHPARKGDLAKGLVGLAVDQPAVGEPLAGLVEPFRGFGRRQAAEQHDEFLAAMPRHMAMIVGDMRQRVGDQFDDAVARLVPVRVVDALEFVDVAKGDAQRLALGARFGIVAIEQRLEGAAVGQAGQIVDLGIALGARQATAERFRFVLALAHILFGLARAFEHCLGKAREISDELAGLLHLFKVDDMLLELAAIIAGDRARRLGVRLERVEVRFEPLNEPVEIGLIGATRILLRDLVEPCLRDTLGRFGALANMACQCGVAPRKGVVRERQIGRRNIEIMVQQERHDRFGKLAPCVAREVVRRALSRRCRNFVGFVLSGVTKPQPVQEPPDRLLRRGCVSGHAPINGWRAPGLRPGVTGNFRSRTVGACAPRPWRAGPVIPSPSSSHFRPRRWC